MNILNLLIKEKSAVGVEINDSVIRVTYFRPKKKFINKKTDGTGEKELVLIEEPIPSNVILSGLIIDKELLAKILRNIWRKENLNKKYAIISIPEDKIYTNLFPFPKTVNDKHLEQAVNLAIDFQLPFKRSEVYVGWENTINSHGSNEVIISAIPKSIADDYIKVLNDANIEVLALESHVASISRSISVNEEEATLVIKENQDSVTLFILKNNNLKFSRTLPALFIKEEEALTKEIIKIKNSFENEYKEKIYEIPLLKATIKEPYKNYFVQNNSIDIVSKWLISTGGALRGELKKGEDKSISLLPISTTEAYKYQKIKTFISLIRNIMIGISIFFLLAFLAAYLFIFSLSQNVKKISTNIPISTTSTDAKGKEELIKNMNSLTLTTSSILNETVNWSLLIDEINSKIIGGIIISSFSAPNINEKITIKGIALNRYVLNEFKKNLQGSKYLAEIELPITNLEQKSNIPFSISFKVKDSSMLYYK